MKKYGNEFKVGLFIIACVVGISYLVISTGKLNLKKEGYSIFVNFDEIAGLQKKAPVMLNGLEVGKVEDITVNYDNEQTKVVLRIWLDKNAKVRDNALVSIKTLGLMGEKYIQIASHKGGAFLKQDSVLEGRPYLDLDAMMEQAQGISEEAKKLTELLNSTAEDNKDSINAIVKNFEELSADIRKHPWKLLYKTK
jgi:phospholipid/cholesterol/gamma-HCH transport system substrate-binding protein